MNPRTTVRLYVKFMDERFLDSFVKQGLLYMNSIQYFREYENEDEALRGDRHEGLHATYRAEKTELTIFGKKISAKGKIDIRLNHHNETNIYCMTAITDEDLQNCKTEEFYLSEKFKNFGSKAVIITEPKEFELRIQKAAETCEFIEATELSQRISGLVAYFNRETYHGPLGIFSKFDDYAWQHEWRIAFKQKKKAGAFELYIGDISDITIVSSTHDLLDHPLFLTRMPD
jgi:hypothetical protein